MPQRTPKVIAKNQQSYSKYLQEKKVKLNDERELRTGEYTYKLWHTRVQTTLRWRMNYWNGDKAWDNACKLYRGKHWRESDEINPTSDNPKDRVTVNITGSTIQSIGPFLMNSPSEFKCSPRKPEAVVSALLQQSMLNYEWKQRECELQVRKALDDAMTIGHGICKTGFILELDEAVKKVDGEIVYDDYIKEEAPYVKRVNPRNIIIDPTASEQNLATARWVAELFFLPINDALSNSNYDQAVIQEIKENKYSIQTKQSLYADSESDEIKNILNETAELEMELGAFFELWDKKYRKYYVFAVGVTPPLVEKDWPYDYLKSFPYKMLSYIPLNDEPFGIGIPYIVQDQQLELNRKRTSMVHHNRIYNRKYEVPEGLSPESKDLLATGADGTIIEVPMNLSGMIKPIQDAPISQDVYTLESIIKEDFRQLTGSDALIQGGALPSRTTAGEVNARGNIFRAKLDDRIKAVNKFILDLGGQVLDHIKANYETQKVTRIVGPQGEMWVQFTVEDIQDDVDIDMESVAAPQTDPTLEKQQTLQLLQIVQGFLPLIQTGQFPIDLVEFFKWMLEKFNVKDASRFFKPSAEPIQPIGGEISTGTQQPQVGAEPMSVQDLQRQVGMAPIQNASGLQLVA